MRALRSFAGGHRPDLGRAPTDGILRLMERLDAFMARELPRIGVLQPVVRILDLLAGLDALCWAIHPEIFPRTRGIQQIIGVPAAHAGTYRV